MTALTGFPTYFEYQHALCRSVVLPWLEPRLSLDGLRVADFGAHGGGMVDELRRQGKVEYAVGFDSNAQVVATTPFAADERFRLELRDMTRAWDLPERFDLILLHDVLEHVPAYDEMLAVAATATNAGGHVFVSMPPYHSAFGGHQQQLAGGAVSRLPWIHLLPRNLFFRLAEPRENEYMTAADSLADIQSVDATRLTLGGLEAALAHNGLEIVARELFLVRPEHALRYSVPTVPAGWLGRIPAVRELLVTGANYLARRR